MWCSSILIDLIWIEFVVFKMLNLILYMLWISVNQIDFVLFEIASNQSQSKWKAVAAENEVIQLVC